jgi:hypothetical protein
VPFALIIIFVVLLALIVGGLAGQREAQAHLPRAYPAFLDAIKESNSSAGLDLEWKRVEGARERMNITHEEYRKLQGAYAERMGWLEDMRL